MLVANTAKLINNRLLQVLVGRPGIGTVTTPAQHPLNSVPKIFGPRSPRLDSTLTRIASPVSVIFYYLNAAQQRTKDGRTFVRTSCALMISATLAKQQLNTRRVLMIDTVNTGTRSPFFCGHIGKRVRRTLVTRG